MEIETYEEQLVRVQHFPWTGHRLNTADRDALFAVLARLDALEAENQATRDALHRLYPAIAGRAITARKEAGDEAARPWEDLAADVFAVLELPAPPKEGEDAN